MAAIPLTPKLQPQSLLRQVYSGDCIGRAWNSCLAQSRPFLLTEAALEPQRFDARGQSEFQPEDLVGILISVNPTTEMLKPGTPAAKKVRNPNLFHPTKPMGMRTRATRGPLDLIRRHTESHALAMFVMAFVLFICSGVFWLSHKQPEEAPPYPLPERAEPMILVTLRRPPIALRHSVGVRSLP